MIKKLIGEVKESPPGNFNSSNGHGGNAVFAPAGEYEIVCGHCAKTVESGVAVDFSIPQSFGCPFCGASNGLPAKANS